MKRIKMVKLVIVILLLVITKSVSAQNINNRNMSNGGSKLNKHMPEKYIEYTVQKGDCISVIADKFKGDRGLENTINLIQYKNNVIEIIYPGQILLVPYK